MKAFDFSLPDQHGDVHTLKDYAGKWLVLYFYPQDDTPGCTAEACSFRDERDVIAELGHAEVVGVSKDSVDSHRAFADKYHLTFTILSDPKHKTIEAYGAWGLMGTKRNTFIINPEGDIVKEYRGVNPKKHAAQIIADLKQLQGRT